MNNEDKKLEALLKMGKMPDPDPAFRDQVFQATHEAWKDTLKEQKRQTVQKQLRYYAAAAVIMLAVGVGLFSYPNISWEGKPTAYIAQAYGKFYLNGTQVDAAEIFDGDVISTGNNGLLAIQLNDETRLTLSANSALVVQSSDAVMLEHGKMYFDSQNINDRIRVSTQWGELVDIGTQYEVATSGQGMEVAMREGKVKMTMDGMINTAIADEEGGDVVSVNAQNEIEKTRVKASDKRWEWMLPGIQAYNMDGASVHGLLEWVSRSTGKRIVYDSNATENVAQQTKLQGGEIKAESAIKTLSMVLETTQFVDDIQEDSIYITIK